MAARPDSELKSYLIYLEDLLGRVRLKKAWLDPEDFQFGIDLYNMGVPEHVIERAVSAVTRGWFEAHPLFAQMRICGISKLRYFRQAILREFKQYREAMMGEGGAGEEDQAVETVPGEFL